MGHTHASEWWGRKRDKSSPKMEHTYVNVYKYNNKNNTMTLLYLILTSAEYKKAPDKFWNP